jgi:superfamily II DNA or RNA helicase
MAGLGGQWVYVTTNKELVKQASKEFAEDIKFDQIPGFGIECLTYHQVKMGTGGHGGRLVNGVIYDECHRLGNLNVYNGVMQWLVGGFTFGLSATPTDRSDEDTNQFVVGVCGKICHSVNVTDLQEVNSLAETVITVL